MVGLIKVPNRLKGQFITSRDAHLDGLSIDCPGKSVSPSRHPAPRVRPVVEQVSTISRDNTRFSP